MTGTEGKTRNVHQDEIFIFQKNPKPFKLSGERWECIGQSINEP